MVQGNTDASHAARPDDPPQERRRSADLTRVALALILVAAVVAFFALGLHRSLSWSAFVRNRAFLQDEAAAHFVLAATIYCAIYVAVTGLSLPGATVLSLAAGALFGRWWGTVLVSVASTLGAIAAFLSTRYLFRDFVERRFGERLEPINRRVDTGGAYYLLTLRLVPIFPFFLVNAAMGLTRMRVLTFWWASQLGMLPATFIYVNAGAELGQIDSPRNVVTPHVMISLVLLGLVPLVARAVRGWAGRRRAPR